MQFALIRGNKYCGWPGKPGGSHRGELKCQAEKGNLHPFSVSRTFGCPLPTAKFHQLRFLVEYRFTFLLNNTLLFSFSIFKLWCAYVLGIFASDHLYAWVCTYIGAHASRDLILWSRVSQSSPKRVGGTALASNLPWGSAVSTSQGWSYKQVAWLIWHLHEL